MPRLAIRARLDHGRNGTRNEAAIVTIPVARNAATFTPSSEETVALSTVTRPAPRINACAERLASRGTLEALSMLGVSSAIRPDFRSLCPRQAVAFLRSARRG